MATTLAAARSVAATTARTCAPGRLLVARPRSTLLTVGGLTSAPRRAARARPIAAASAAAAPSAAAPSAAAEQPITLTPAAMRQLERLRREEGRDSVLLRMGVRSGGCSGMSYDMKFEDEANVDPEDDSVLEFSLPPLATAAAAAEAEAAGGADASSSGKPLRVAVDGKSLLFLFGMQVDYSDALVGGGFKFVNPQATDTCGCGKSFSA
jgi:iron-sulfur cluster assembly protein